MVDEQAAAGLPRRIKQGLKAIPAVSAGLTVAEHAFRRIAFGRFLDAENHALDREQARVLDVLRAHGIAIVPGFWPRERCAEAIAAIDGFIDAHPERTWTCDYGADRRVYGLERVSPVARSFWEDRRLWELCEAYWGASVVNGFVSAGRLDGTRAAGNAGSGGLPWHKDGVTQQFKVILYLDDVGPENGPFQYVRGTRTLGGQVRHIMRSGAQFRQLRWTDEGVARMEATDPHAVVTVCGAAGTLVIAATSGIHRGRPIAAGTRYSLTNYYFARSTLAPVVRYYNNSVVQADGRALTVEDLAACRPAAA